MGYLKTFGSSLGIFLLAAAGAHAGEADLAIPDLHAGKFDSLGGISAWNLLFYGSFVILGTLGISLYQIWQIHRQPAHKSMLDVAEIIFQTCKTYLIQQGKFLLMLFVLIACAMTYYFMALQDKDFSRRRKSALVLRRGNGRFVRGGLVRHSRQHLRQLPAPRSLRCGASRGTSSISPCGPACRSACS